MILNQAKNLWWLLILLGLIVLEVWHYRQNDQQLKTLFPGELFGLIFKNWNKRKHLIKRGLFLSALFFLIIALSGPEWGKRTELSGRKGIDIVFAIDTSRSMLVEDLKPNRLENAKISLALLLDELAGNRLGLVAFSGTAFIQCPLTSDVDVLKLFLSSIDTNLIPNPGTDIGAAITAGVKAFGKSTNNKALILLTDGEELDGSAVAGADLAAKNNIKIFAVGLGSLDGATIPDGNGIKKDKQGQPVISRANPLLLAMLAKKTHGFSFMISNSASGFQELFSAINLLPKQKLKNSPAYQYQDRFQIFLGLGLLCLVLEMLISERKDVK
ncbi:hypothetical protein COT42_07850 [Candidatus Saganbacteria bacterium CG08_land_8_20_14_0_20_45_16]|uniref:VWFA domain-containing protein n=1 Tax=Candidatus Saganbacteria bacterium CG08_land_8_20_14_0_20_45_16 TaxID=2014293 RepID=A0A2H0XUG6_UNCSA|nr:MAG: hypothetical protein COT42_07850 [Candidatus Saganbacteria bacterium CG08_land_8_20_14_0_20_45_16]